MSWEETDPIPDTRPFTLAAAFMAARKYADVAWSGDATGTEIPISIAPRRLRHWREEFYLFNGCIYEQLILEEMLSDLTRFMNHLSYFDPKRVIKPLRLTRGVEGDVLYQLRRLCQVRAEMLPVWIQGKNMPDPKRVVAFNNGLLSIDRWLGDYSTPLIQPTDNWFSTSALPCNYEPAAKCGQWLNFLDQSLDNDGELILLLQEWFGYCLTSDTSLQKMLWLHGVSGSGKSTLTYVLQQMVGEKSCVSFDLWSLLGTHGLAPFLHKRLAISADSHLGSGTDAEKVLGKLKGISGEDDQQIDRKYREQLASIKLSVRFVISTNEFPNLPDASDALARRAMFIPFNRSFQGQENSTLKHELVEELPGIIVWALHGLERLLEQGRFSEAKAAQHVADQFKRMQSPVHAFVQDCCTVTAYTVQHNGTPARGVVDSKLIYKAYCAYSEESGKSKLSAEKFGERLRRAVPTVERVQKQTSGLREWHYRGIELTESAITEYVNKGAMF
jgi:putative DNA primase/helicase